MKIDVGPNDVAILPSVNPEVIYRVVARGENVYIVARDKLAEIPEGEQYRVTDPLLDGRFSEGPAAEVQTFWSIAGAVSAIVEYADPPLKGTD